MSEAAEIGEARARAWKEHDRVRVKQKLQQGWRNGHHVHAECLAVSKCGSTQHLAEGAEGYDT